MEIIRRGLTVEPINTDIYLHANAAAIILLAYGLRQLRSELIMQYFNKTSTIGVHRAVHAAVVRHSNNNSPLTRCRRVPESNAFFVTPARNCFFFFFDFHII